MKKILVGLLMTGSLFTAVNQSNKESLSTMSTSECVSGGNGTSATDARVICTAEQFIAIATDFYANPDDGLDYPTYEYYKLGADIVLEDFETEGWLASNINGNNHSITLKGTSDSFIGIWYYIAAHVKIENLFINVDNFSRTGSDNNDIGILATDIAPDAISPTNSVFQMNNVHLTGNINYSVVNPSWIEIGGLVHTIDDTKMLITNSSFNLNSTFTGGATGDYWGGLFSKINYTDLEIRNTEINYVYTTNSQYDGNYGQIAAVSNGDNDIIIKNSVIKGALNTNNGINDSNIGALIGNMHSTDTYDIENIIVSTQFKNTGDVVNSFVGYIFSDHIDQDDNNSCSSVYNKAYYYNMTLPTATQDVTYNTCGTSIMSAELTKENLELMGFSSDFWDLDNILDADGKLILTTVYNPSKPSGASPVSPSDSKSNSNLWLIIGGSVAAVAVIGLGVFFFIKKKKA